MNQASISPSKFSSRFKSFFRGNLGGWIVILAMVLLPFITSLISGQSISNLLANESGMAKFVQGLAIEIFILALYALSYDLILGVTGLLSFGHAMFFAVGAYLTGILLKSFGWSLWATLGMVLVAAIIQAILFAVVLPRVQGVTFALVTLGIASVFYIVIQSHEMSAYAGADVGLQGVVAPEFINAADHRMRFYFVTLGLLIGMYLLYKRFVNSPTGRVCIAIRENEKRALMLGYNTFYFKLIALTLASITAALAGCLHALFQPIVSPHTASMGFTIAALLMTLIGGVGTLSGALVGAAIYRLLEYGLKNIFGEQATFLLGVVYVLIVLFLPYGIIGTWKLRALQIRSGWQRLIGLVTGKPKQA
ncbi:MAG: branched-chain amino acid ABC transporter permease [Chloroflexi bacterium]|nr:branched-chain amino acid ABC transporter permease [Chloroflexota bacterium]